MLRFYDFAHKRWASRTSPCTLDGKRISLSAESDLRLCLKNPRFFEKNRVKLSNNSNKTSSAIFYKNKAEQTFFVHSAFVFIYSLFEVF